MGRTLLEKGEAITGNRLNSALSIRVPELWKERIEKAAAKNEQTVGEYARDALAYYMASRNEWSIPGPRKEQT